MVYIPTDAEWYLAEIVERFKVHDELSSTIHVNFILVRAATPEQAFEKATAFGKVGKEPYTNSDGKIVTPEYLGLRNLHVIYEPLEDGSEIVYERYEDVVEGDAMKMVKQKNELNVFRVTTLRVD